MRRARLHRALASGPASTAWALRRIHPRPLPAATAPASHGKAARDAPLRLRPARTERHHLHRL